MPDQVAPRLFVGSKPPPGHHADYDTIVLMAIEYQPPAQCFPGSEVLHAGIDDDPSRPMRSDEIAKAVEMGHRIARRLRAGRTVLSTCAMGLNRSALVAAIAMHEVHDMSAEEIIKRLRYARGDQALRNPHFEKLLRTVIAVKKEK